MEFTNNSQIQQLSNSRVLLGLERICLFAAMVLLVVWPLKDTIAARNTALVVGCFTSLVWVVIARPRVNLQKFIPALLLLAVPAWLWIHYYFLPTDTVAQLYDLKGTWLRVILAVFMASGLGLMISGHPKLIYWVWGALALLAMITFIAFLIEVKNTHQWVLNDFRFPFKYKSAVVYFLMWPCLWAYAVLHFCIALGGIGFWKKRTQIILGIIGLGLASICWVDFIAAHALNGVLIAGLLGTLLLAIYFKHIFFNKKRKGALHWLLLAMVLLGLIFALTVFWRYDQKYENKLGNLVRDIRIAVQIDKYQQWRRDPSMVGPRNPAGESGRTPNESTYNRAAWFVSGSQLLWEHPLGAGFSHLAYRYFMHQENRSLLLYMTHSGWLDYALGLGVPGLLLTWAAMGMAGWRSCRYPCVERGDLLIKLSSGWLLLGVWLLWWPTEVSEREFIEYLFFMVSLISATLPPIKPQHVQLEIANNHV